MKVFYFHYMSPVSGGECTKPIMCKTKKKAKEVFEKINPGVKYRVSNDIMG